MVYEAELARIHRNARTAVARLAAAQQARRSGNTRIAGRLLRVLVLDRRTPEAYRAAARAALAEMREEAQQQMAELEQRLADSDVSQPRSAERMTAQVLEILEGLHPEDDRLISSAEPGSTQVSGTKDVLATFAQMEELLWQYETVPGATSGLRRRLGRLRREVRYARILNEPEAAALCQQSRRHEQAEELCCAYLTYQRAVRLAPSRSARFAQERLRQMSEDPHLEISVERCRNLRECHKNYRLGELFAKARSFERARASFEQVLDVAPPDSTVHAAALEQLRRLASEG